MDVFAEARRLTTWHYQWLIVHEFLPQIVGQAMVDDVLRRGRRFYRPRRGEAFMPVEFQTGTYRMGHSMVRPSYRANLAGDNGQPFFGFIFDPSQEGRADPDDLRGGRARRAPVRRLADLLRLRRRRGQAEQEDRHEDLDGAVHTCRSARSRAHDAPTALPQRNLLRHLTWQLPSGQSVARAMGVTPLAAADLQELAPLGVGFERSTPLWYYVLKEAEVVADGLHLGPVGGRIVAEVFIGLLQTDPSSYLAAQPRWRPTLPSRTGTFRMTDFLTFAGVDPGVARAVRRRSAQAVQTPPGHGRGDRCDEEREDGGIDHGAIVRRAAPALLPARRPTGQMTDVRQRGAQVTAAGSASDPRRRRAGMTCVA